MAIYLPIVSEFKSGGIDKAVKEFKSLETASQKASFAIKKAAVPAAAALAGLAVASVDAAKAAAEDAAAAEKLAQSLRNNTDATNEQLEAVEEWITKTSIASAVADDDLRPALDNLVRGTKDVTQAQKLLTLALDISAGTGKDLDAVTQALSKAYNGQLGPLRKLDPALAKVIEAGGSTDDVFKSLAKTFGGQAATAAGTAEGKFKSMQIALGEAKESIGAALLPAIIVLAEKLTGLATFVQENSDLILAFGIVVGGAATAIVAINAAMKAWAAINVVTTALNAALATSFSALWVATGAAIVLAVVAALVVLERKFGVISKVIEALKIVFDKVWEGIKVGVRVLGDLFKTYANTWLKVFGKVFNLIAAAWNNTLGKIAFTIPSWVPLLGGKSFSIPKMPTWEVPQLAEGGIVTGPTLAMIGERGPEAVIPLTGRNTPGNTVNITVNGALDPVAVARQIRQILSDDARRGGRLNVVAAVLP